MIDCKGFQECTDRCEDAYQRDTRGWESETHLDRCLDRCDERFATGTEPKGDIIQEVTDGEGQGETTPAE